MIWLRKYPRMIELSNQFGISVSCVHKIIHRLLPVLHHYLVPKYIRWHSMQHWRRLRGTFPEWPRVVAIIDGTPFRISRPKGDCFLYFSNFVHKVIIVQKQLPTQNINCNTICNSISRLFPEIVLQGQQALFFYELDSYCRCKWLCCVQPSRVCWPFAW